MDAFLRGENVIPELARRRKTVREFRSVRPPLEKVLRCIGAAKEAPSGMNAQPWRFLIVSNEDVKRRIKERCEKNERAFHESVGGKLGSWLKEKGITWKKPFLEEAPYLVLVFSQKDAPFSKESTWLAVGYLLLALEEEGLATVTYTPPMPQSVAEIVNASKNLRLEAILPVGYSDDEKPKHERKSLEEVVSFESFAEAGDS